MIRAVFIDYMGTLVQEESEYANAVIGRCFKQSKATKPSEVAAWWFFRHDELLEECNKNEYKTEYEIAYRTFLLAMEHFQFTDDAHMLCEMLTKHWTCSPPFGDAVPFLQNCPVPVFVVSSNDTLYLEEGLRRLDVPIAGLVSSEMSGAYKPDARLFKKALEVRGCLPEEVIHIGDSLRSDALGAQKAGIKPLLLDRYGKYGPCVFEKVSSLTEALEWLLQKGCSR